jgi:hypothetical protein
MRDVTLLHCWPRALSPASIHHSPPLREVRLGTSNLKGHDIDIALRTFGTAHTFASPYDRKLGSQKRAYLFPVRCYKRSHVLDWLSALFVRLVGWLSKTMRAALRTGCAALLVLLACSSLRAVDEEAAPTPSPAVPEPIHLSWEQASGGRPSTHCHTLTVHDANVPR